MASVPGNVVCKFSPAGTSNSTSQLLGISTTGKGVREKAEPRRKQHGLEPDVLQELGKMTFAWASRLTGFTKQLHKCPEIDDAKVKGYITPEMARKYKLTRSYQLKHMIHSVKFNELPSSVHLCVIKGRCNLSQSTNEDDGAALPPDATCTDVPCYWANPKGAAVKPKTIDSIQLKPEEKCKMRRTSTDYGLLFANAVPPPTKDEVLQLRGDLIDATLPLGIILPAVNALHASRFGPIKGSKGPVALPDKVYCISLTKPPETKVESLRYGTEKEKVARTQYFNEMVKQHQDFNIDETGLVVHPEKPFLRASPDGIAKRSCHSSRTIEIKCPFTARDMTVEEAPSIMAPFQCKNPSLVAKNPTPMYNQMIIQSMKTRCSLVLPR
ncbi:hypothetical protein Bbelb_272200 [Branchiostoma belcheri]|nr:hypothetical protein Bbelb_272200 [Branchiostoma belcheri]